MQTMPESSAEKSKLRELVARCLEQLDDRGLAIVDEVCATAPGLAAVVRRRLEALQRLGLAPVAAGSPDQGFPERLGDFRLKRCIGGGGMGVVYLAEQESLRRTVALKLIRPEHLFFPNARERFRREIEAVARLGHPAVVPIHVCGEAGGVPYYAMEWVDGASVEELLQQLRGRSPRELSGADLRAALQACRDARAADLLPVEEAPPADVPGSPFTATNWVDACFRIALPVAHALAHAHRHGIVHRDLKPSNLMLTRDGRVLVVDFGLASTRGHSRLTQSGALLGSLPFVPPELLSGGADKADSRCDFYSLGVTLRELLTLDHVFGRSAADAESTRAAILAGDAPSMRARLPTLPWDAETVCLVAMERDPARRYVDAAALAADIDAVLSRQAIRARRPAWPLRLARLARRHATAAVAFGGLIIAGLAAAGVFAWQQQRRIDALAEVNVELERQADRLRRAVTTFLDETGNLSLANVPGAEALRRELVEQAVAVLDELYAENPSPPLRNDLARACARLAVRCDELGDAESAAAAIDRATALTEGADALPVATFEDRLAAAFVFGNRSLLVSRAPHANAPSLLVEAERRFGALHAERPDAETSRLHGQSMAALIRSPALTVDEASAVAARLVALIDEQPSEERDVSLELARARSERELAQRFGIADRHDEAILCYRRSIERLEVLDRRLPDYVATLGTLCVARFELGQQLRVADQSAAALDELASARAVAERLALLFPGRAEFKMRVGHIGLVEGEARLDEGDAAGAVSVLQAAAASLAAASAQAPGEAQSDHYRSGVQRALANASLALDDRPGAALAIEIARAVAAEQVTIETENPWAHSLLAEAWLLTARKEPLLPPGCTRLGAAERAFDAAATAIALDAAVPDFAEIAREAGAIAVEELVAGEGGGAAAAKALLQRLLALRALPGIASDVVFSTTEFAPLRGNEALRELLAGEQ